MITHTVVNTEFLAHFQILCCKILLGSGYALASVGHPLQFLFLERVQVKEC